MHIERTSMGFRIDSPCKSGDDRESDCSQFARETASGCTRSVRRGSGTDDRNPRLRECAYPAPHQQNRRCIGQSGQGAWIGRVRERNNADAEPLELALPPRTHRLFVGAIQLRRQQFEL